MLPNTNYQLVKAKTISPVDLNSTNVQGHAKLEHMSREILHCIKFPQVTE